MSVTTDVKKSGNALQAKAIARLNLTEARKPLFAVAGAADLAIEQVKEIPADLTQYVTTVQGFVAEFPTQAKASAGKLSELATAYASKATETYAELAVRGERLVGSIRRQPATQAAVAEGKQAVAKAEAAVKAGTRAVKATEKAVEDAAAKIG